MNRNTLQEELIHLRKLIKKDRREILSIPEGTFGQTIKNGRIYYTLYQDGKIAGITKDKALVRQLMRREFLLESKIHITGTGVAVQSKEEREIGNILESKGIAYRYEWVQYLNGQKYVPDFTIKRESDEKIIFWEHFGMIKNFGITLSSRFPIPPEL